MKKLFQPMILRISGAGGGTVLYEYSIGFTAQCPSSYRRYFFFFFFSIECVPFKRL
jgi:hypothetical protein